MGTVRAVDATALACYCEAVGRLRIATRIVGESGPLLMGDDGHVRKNPAVSQARDASYEVRMWARGFGLDTLGAVAAADRGQPGRGTGRAAAAMSAIAELLGYEPTGLDLALVAAEAGLPVAAVRDLDEANADRVRQAAERLGDTVTAGEPRTGGTRG